MTVEKLSIVIARVKTAAIRATQAANYTDEVFKGLVFKGLAQENHINFHKRALEAAKKAEIMASNVEKARCFTEKEEISNIEKVAIAAELEVSIAEAARTSIICAEIPKTPALIRKQNRCWIC